jgi:hypothetical protein
MIWHLVLISLLTGSSVFTLSFPSGLTDQQGQMACSRNAGIQIGKYTKAHTSTTHIGRVSVKAACQKF